jgi:hypothetical protein
MYATLESKTKRAEGGGQKSFVLLKEGYYWNEHIKPEKQKRLLILE